MLVESLLTIANGRCHFTSPGRPSTGSSYKEAPTALNTYFTPQKSLQFERHTFRQAHQAPNESTSQYVTRLRQLGEHCDFDKYSLDEAIKGQLIEHCHSYTLRRRLLREKSTVSLSSLIDIARSMESANFQAQTLKMPRPKKTRNSLTTPILSEEEQCEFYFRQTATMYTLR